MNIPSNQPITAAVYGKKAAVRKPKPVDPTKPVRKPRVTTVGESISPHAAAALVALRDELEAAQPKKRRRKPNPEAARKRERKDWEKATGRS